MNLFSAFEGNYMPQGGQVDIEALMAGAGNEDGQMDVLDGGNGVDPFVDPVLVIKKGA